jgi:hypothetical protein
MIDSDSHPNAGVRTREAWAVKAQDLEVNDKSSMCAGATSFSSTGGRTWSNPPKSSQVRMMRRKTHHVRVAELEVAGIIIDHDSVRVCVSGNGELELHPAR